MRREIVPEKQSYIRSGRRLRRRVDFLQRIMGSHLCVLSRRGDDRFPSCPTPLSADYLNQQQFLLCYAELIYSCYMESALFHSLFYFSFLYNKENMPDSLKRLADVLLQSAKAYQREVLNLFGINIRLIELRFPQVVSDKPVEGFP